MMTFEEWWGQWPEARSKSLWQKKDCHTAWQAAIKQERERCAKIAENLYEDANHIHYDIMADELGREIAAAIREADA